MNDAAACARRIHELYADDLRGEAGLLHVAVVWRSPERDLINIAMNDAKPASPTDDFVLGVARARADAIITTGANLRLERNLTHAYHPDTQTADALACWRREVLGKDEAPLSVVLTRDTAIDLEHRLFQHAQRSLVFTGEGATSVLRDRSRAEGLVLVGDAAPDLAGLFYHLRRREGCATLSVEAGPSTARALYGAEGPRVDELMLSLCLEPDLAPRARAGPFVEVESIEALLGPAASRCEVEEPSGRWSFRRYRRGSPGRSK
ncbi:MAG: dihydrofolate reductase family protein [Deltaproteobacteria bacterium]|nr:dihydrofolate reductase family protein [Deltaproteobacteria bacterium]MBW2421190.1 dihydrofolate reductase family protein [Deltaproteobacteria bacterium]